MKGDHSDPILRDLGDRSSLFVCIKKTDESVIAKNKEIKTSQKRYTDVTYTLHRRYNTKQDYGKLP